MECERVRRGVNAGSCSGVCDAMECCGGGGADKNVAPLSGGPLLTLERELVGTESGFPSRPGLACAWKAVPVGALFWKTAGGKEGDGGYGRQPFIVDGKRRSDGFTLCFLQPVDVFRNSRILVPPAEGGREEEDDVGGLEAAAAALEARGKVLEATFYNKVPLREFFARLKGGSGGLEATDIVSLLSAKLG